MTGAKLKHIAKAIAATVGALAITVGTWLGTLPDGPISTRSWVTLVVALLGSFGVGRVVWQVPNGPVPPAA